MKLPRGDPEENMARDWGLLEAVARGEAPGAFRFYLWSRPAISGGFLSPPEEAGLFDLPALSRDGVEVVRRPTGGGFLYHGPDLSFALAVRPFPGAEREVARAVARGLRRLGLPAGVAGETGFRPDGESRSALCFARPSPGEVVVEGRKIAGLARRRVRGGLLFQASLYLTPGPEAILRYLKPDLRARFFAPSSSAWPAADLSSLLGREVRGEEVAGFLEEEMEALLRCHQPG